ncbi:uncharacterized protein [Hoplias malabaricus]
MAALHNVSENAQLVDEEFMGKLKEQIPNLREVSRVEDCDFILNYCHFDPDAGLDPATVLHNQPNFPEKLKFLRGVSGNTLHSDEDFIKKLKEKVPDLKEVSTVEECDFILFFCPIVSRPGTDIEAALQKLQRLSDTKPAFVVVLHHTLDPDSVVPDSSRIVKRERTLSVDCLYHEDEGLLQCFRNDETLYNISEWINPQENISNPPQLFYGADPDTQEEKSTESTADTKPPLVVKIHHTPDTTRTVVDNSYSDDGKKNLTENYLFYKNQGTSIRHKKSEDVNHVVDLIQEEVVNPVEPNVWFTNHSEHSVTDAQRGLTESRLTSAKKKIPKTSQKRTAKHLKPSQRSTAKYPKPPGTQKLKFLRGVSGHTLYSDKDFIKKLKQQVPNLKEVSTVEECDFILFFCPIVSRPGTDIEGFRP